MFMSVLSASMYVCVCVCVNSGHNVLKAWQSVHYTRILFRGKCAFSKLLFLRSIKTSGKVKHFKWSLVVT